MVLEILGAQTQRQGVYKMLDKLMVITMYAIPTIMLLVTCLVLAKKK
jgi:hypothetical protein